MLIDTHAHVNFSGFKDDADAVLQRALDMDMIVINVGTQMDTSKEAVEIAQKYKEQLTINNPQLTPNVYAVVGLHPVHTYSQELDEEETHFKTRAEYFDTSMYRSLAQSPLVVGIGECGLDYYRLPIEDLSLKIEDVKQLQRDAFVAQVRLAKGLDKALVIHCRPSTGSMDAYEDILKILDEEFLTDRYHTTPSRQVGTPLLSQEGNTPQNSFVAPHAIGAKLRSSPPNIGGVPHEVRGGGMMRFEIHSFTGTPDIVQEFLKRGAYVGVNGIITFDKTGNMEQVVKAVPLDRIILETDCPYLTPAPNRGKKNEPSFVKFVAEKVAQIKELTVEQVAASTSSNAKKLFNI